MALPGLIGAVTLPCAGRIAWYQDGPARRTSAPPLLLIHSISAASSAYDMQPIYEYVRQSRMVYALDLPGFGLSDRNDIDYTPRLMTDAICVMTDQIRRDTGAPYIDAMALSLSCEFLARAATELPSLFRSVAMISPTGFEHRRLRENAPGAQRGSALLHKALLNPLWRRALYQQLTRPTVIRHFLRRTFGSDEVPTDLLAYDIVTSRPPGAEFAPLTFLAGRLFSDDSGTLYKQLSQPAWLVHGNRGAFANFQGIDQLPGHDNWHVDQMDTGAMPQFENLQEFIHLYERWSLGLR